MMPMPKIKAPMSGTIQKMRYWMLYRIKWCQGRASKSQGPGMTYVQP